MNSETIACADGAAKALDTIFENVNRADMPGLVVGVAHRGKTIYRRGFGLASLEHLTPNTPDTRMRLASITKHFTCFAALLLAEEGKLDLDAPASQILPELKPLAGMPTLRQFMHHASGYHCFMELFVVGGGMSWRPKGTGLALQLAQTDVSFAPGEKQLYCNGGYELLSEAIARASGMSFEQFMAERIFKPLGMHGTACVPSDMIIVPGIATFHQAMPDGSWLRGITPMDDNRGAGSMVSTVDDMLVWMSQMRGATRLIGSEPSWRQLTEVATLNNGQETPYALGLFKHRYKGLEVIHHGGSLMGVSSQMVSVPEHALDIIIMCNGALVNPVQMAWDIVEALLPEHITGETPALATTERFKHLIGTRYHHPPSGMLYGFGEAGPALGLSIQNSPYAPILRDRGDIIGFRMEEAGMGPLEIRAADMVAAPDGSAPAELVISECGQGERFSLLPATPPSTRALGQRLVGRYRCDDLLADASIAFEGDQLVLRTATPDGRRAAVLEALSDTVFSYRAIDPLIPMVYAIALEHDEDQQLTGFRLTSARARRILFTRRSD